MLSAHWRHRFSRCHLRINLTLSRNNQHDHLRSSHQSCYPSKPNNGKVIKMQGEKVTGASISGGCHPTGELSQTETQWQKILFDFSVIMEAFMRLRGFRRDLKKLVVDWRGPFKLLLFSSKYPSCWNERRRWSLEPLRRSQMRFQSPALQIQPRIIKIQPAIANNEAPKDGRWQTQRLIEKERPLQWTHGLFHQKPVVWLRNCQVKYVWGSGDGQRFRLKKKTVEKCATDKPRQCGMEEALNGASWSRSRQAEGGVGAEDW